MPKELMDLVDEDPKSRKWGYRSRAEFVAEAVREKLAISKSSRCFNSSNTSSSSLVFILE
ncbi:MAG: hypothetical protein QXQ31_08355 [Zestosphaera sp.]